MKLFRDRDCDTIVVLSVAIRGSGAQPIQSVRIRLSATLKLSRMRHLRVEADVEVRQELDLWRVWAQRGLFGRERSRKMCYWWWKEGAI
jgi:hypothetical protein